MQKLAQFFTKYRFLALFIFLEFLCFSMIVRFNSYQNALYFNSTNTVSARLLNFSSSISSYFSLQQENSKLHHENKELREIINTYIQENKLSLLDLNSSDLFPDTVKAKYEFIPGKIINNSTFSLNNFLTINKGSKQGVKKGMGIISSNGIVGKVKYVSDSYSIAVSVLNSKSTVSAEIKGKKILGSIEWDGENYRYAQFKYVPRHLNIVLGDTIVTSGYNATYPSNLSIGVISESDIEEGESFYDIEIKLTNDFNTLRQVLFVDNKQKDEQTELELKSIE